VLVRVIAAALRAAPRRLILTSVIVSVFLFDNAVWFLWVGKWEHNGSYGLTLNTAEQAVIEQFREPRYAGYLVVSESPKLGYLATVYSPLRSWRSHEFNTPYAELRKNDLDRFFADGSEPNAWHNRPVMAVIQQQEATTKLLNAAGFRTILSNGQFRVLARDLPLPKLP
jgi:hypothetical protein